MSLRQLWNDIKFHAEYERSFASVKDNLTFLAIRPPHFDTATQNITHQNQEARSKLIDSGMTVLQVVEHNIDLSPSHVDLRHKVFCSKWRRQWLFRSRLWPF
ncbi:hypothetical protein L202_04314 [Cryptococcus amylolentus CBS 6039]|uniref:Uncharacterized protein n=2 Tax=Cryptococcus amylolentus TaxID=104669 RepID=A0A1E3HR16_9TREE|nr:hypothetical protein L202_04314 [Cryptococcus amylolentus CBS 6039]ODN78752.1 hypothetical protein L202_04314 [Cryptococcus amylolentus CBS 6039]ODO06746.1 hypothetical protein I350_04105 [Cryptococcus amylolentus CBS 6273]